MNNAIECVCAAVAHKFHIQYTRFGFFCAPTNNKQNGTKTEKKQQQRTHTEFRVFACMLEHKVRFVIYTHGNTSVSDYIRTKIQHQTQKDANNYKTGCRRLN